MILYHGSKVEVKEIDLNRSEVGKDFGVGFQIRRLLAGIIDIDTFLTELKFKQGVTFQYFFATERSIKYHKRI